MPRTSLLRSRKEFAFRVKPWELAHIRRTTESSLCEYLHYKTALAVVCSFLMVRMPRTSLLRSRKEFAFQAKPWEFAHIRQAKESCRKAIPPHFDQKESAETHWFYWVFGTFSFSCFRSPIASKLVLTTYLTTTKFVFACILHIPLPLVLCFRNSDFSLITARQSLCFDELFKKFLIIYIHVCRCLKTI